MAATYTHKFDTQVYKGSVTVNTGLFIDGKWIDPIKGDHIDVIDPTTGICITTVAGGGSEDVDTAVTAARKAYKTAWGLKVPGSERGKLIAKLADLFEKYQDELSALEALNVGKHFHNARMFDLGIAIRALRYYAGWSDKIHGKTIEVDENKFAYTRHEPWGVVGAIVPWNFPLMMAIGKLAPALATGNTIVLKPSEVTPLTTLFIGNLINEAGFPPGVVNIVNGYGDSVGSAISSHPSIDKVTFTGSTFVGRKVLKSAADSNLKAVTLELGGKSPTVVFDDVDLDQAVKWAACGIFPNMGQACIAGSRIYVQEGIYDEFLKGFTSVAEGLTKATGGPFDEGVQHGPQVSKTQYDRVMGYISSGKQQGAKVHIGGESFGGQGYFIKPTIFVDTEPTMQIMREEIFGPVCAIVKFKSEEEVTEWANDTTYGLAANILTQNSSRAIRMANALEAGIISVNCAQSADVGVPFGGYKQSGIGREMGQEALDTFTQVKGVHVNIGQVL